MNTLFDESIIDVSNGGDNEILSAIKPNVNRVTYQTSNTVSNANMAGDIIFNNINPSSRNIGIKNLRIHAHGVFTITTTASALTALKVMNINDTLYNCVVDLNGGINNTQDPFIYSEILRQYNENYCQYDEQIHNDKYVDLDVVENAAHTQFTITYDCVSPLYHTFLMEEIAGVNKLNINCKYNLYGLFRTIASVAAVTSITVANFGVSLSYDQIMYTTSTKPIYSYSSYLPIVYTTTSTQNQVSIRDTTAAPLNTYLFYLNNLSGNVSTTQLRQPNKRFDQMNISINSQSNYYKTDNTRDIFTVSRSTGYKHSFNDFTGKRLNLINDGPASRAGVASPPIAAYSLLNSNFPISTADIYRCDITGIQTTNVPYADGLNNDASTYYLYTVYLYPCVLILGEGMNSYQYALSKAASDLPSSDVNETYIEMLEKDGTYAGGSKFTDFFKNISNKMRESKFLSKTLKTIGAITPAIASFVPGGPLVQSLVKRIPNKLGEMAEDAGLSTVMF